MKRMARDKIEIAGNDVILGQRVHPIVAFPPT